jgi:hypothetical protein
MRSHNGLIDPFTPPPPNISDFVWRFLRATIFKYKNMKLLLHCPFKNNGSEQGIACCPFPNLYLNMELFQLVKLNVVCTYLSIQYCMYGMLQYVFFESMYWSGMNFFLSGYNHKITLNISGWRRKRFWSCLGR